MSPESFRVPRTGAARWSVLGLGVVAGLVIGAALAVAWISSGTPDGTSGATAGPDGGARVGGPGGPPLSPVEVAPTVEIVAAEPVQLLGTAAPVRTSVVASEAEGTLVQLLVDEGDHVRAGQVLARLRRTTIEQQLAAAVAAKRETQARLVRAEADFERLATLLERQAVSRREYEQAVADRDALRRGIERLEAEAARLRDLLDRTEVRAPFAGEVAAVHTEVGEWVGRGGEIATLVDLSRVEVQVQVAERYIGAVRPGFEVLVRFDALPGREFTGRVAAVVPQALAQARTFPVLVRVDNADGAVRSGMAARVLAQLGSPVPALLVSKDGIVRRNDQVLVFRVAVEPAGAGGAAGEGSRGRIEQVPVLLGPARGGWYVAYGKLAAGDLIVVRGNERVFPGQQVVVAAVRRPATPAADPALPIARDPRETVTR